MYISVITGKKDTKKELFQLLLFKNSILSQKESLKMSWYLELELSLATLLFNAIQ